MKVEVFVDGERFGGLISDNDIDNLQNLDSFSLYEVISYTVNVNANEKWVRASEIERIVERCTQ
jgi:hypothetical protein